MESQQVNKICALIIEKQIMQYCWIKPENINDNNVEKYINELKK